MSQGDNIIQEENAKLRLEVRALKAAIATTKREAWNAALLKVGQDFQRQYWPGTVIDVIEVIAFLSSRHVHYPECREEVQS